MRGAADSLVERGGLQGDERDDGVAERLAEGTQILPVLQVDDHLSMEAVPCGVLNRFKIPIMKTKL